MRSTCQSALPASLLMIVALAALAGCSHRDEPLPLPRASIAPTNIPTPRAEYVGNQACARCHTAEAGTYLHSRHVHTLSSMDPVSLGKLAPPPGRVPGTDIVLERNRAGYVFGVVDDPVHRQQIHLAVGSGKTGMTYVASLETDLLELRKSYFPSTHRWYLTPGHQSQPPTSVGLLYDSSHARACLLCHATTIAAGRLLPEPRFFGVGCESCHGPGSLHVAAIQRGEPSPAGMVHLASWSATRINELCGTCHRTQKDVSPGSLQATATNRFQGFGLMRSRCFRESGGHLSCLNCHNPHSNASENLKTFEAACLKCHSSPAPRSKGETGPGPAAKGAGTSNQVVGQVCPVNPVHGCVGCHMPARKAFPGTTLPTTIADHFIRVYREPGGGAT